MTVTATLTGSGAAWPAQLPQGWTRQSATVATFAVKFVALACTRVVPVAPTVKPATCVNGVVTDATVTVATTPTGVTYVALPPPPYLGTQNHVVNVRAVLIDGYAWGQMPPGWVHVEHDRGEVRGDVDGRVVSGGDTRCAIGD